MKVHWTAAAEAHLDAIYSDIAQDSETYALRMVDRITKAIRTDRGIPAVGSAGAGIR